MIKPYIIPFWLLKKCYLFILPALLAGTILLLWPVSVVWAADPVFVRTDGNNAYCDGTTNDPYPGSGSGLTCAFHSIQHGVDMVDPAGTINVARGTYTETITVNRHVKIIGAGSGNNPASDTILHQVGNNGIVTITYSGTSSIDPILFKNLRVEPVNTYGFGVTSGNIEYIELDNVQVIGSNPTNDTETEIGLRVNTTASLSNLRIINSAFDRLTYGWYFFKYGDWGPGGSNVTNVYVADTSFSHNDAKGIYVEKLSDATFEDCIVHNNGLDIGFSNATWNAGFDINLKGEETYQNLVFNNMVVTNNGLSVANGAGFMIKARDDGGTYGAHPAQLNNVQINNSIFSGNVRGIRFGEPNGANNAGPTQVTVTYSKIATNTYGLINETQAPITATLNWWNSPTGPTHTGNPGGAGDIISNTVTYSPWLCDGTDTSPDIGFQPITTTRCAIPTRLAYSVHPGNGTVDNPLATQPVIRAEDADGNLGINFSSAITVTLNPGSATLTGTNPVNAVEGVANFSDLAVDAAGVYTLTASAQNLAGVTSNPFTISSGSNIYLPIIYKN